MDQRIQTRAAAKPFQYFFRTVDIIVLEVAYYLSFLTVPLVRSVLLSADTTVHLEITFLMALLVPFIWLFILDVRGLYGDPARIPHSQLISRLFQTTLLGLGAMSLVLFALKEGEFSRLLLFIFGIYSFLILAAVRVAEKWLLCQPASYRALC